MKIAVVTDSTAYLSKEIREKQNIFMIPLLVVFENKSYEEEVTITAEEFYKKLKESPDFPKSSQPSIGAAYELYEKLSKEYDAIISVHLSSGISGTYQSVVSISQEFPELNIYPFDSEISCYPQARYVLEASRLARSGEAVTPEIIIEKLNALKNKTEAYFMVDDLNNLQRGGRLSNSAATLGSLLKIKPILYFSDKKIIVFEKIRTNKKALKRLEGLLGKAVKSAGYPLVATVISGNIPEEADDWMQHLQKKYPNVRFEKSYFGPVIGTHLGEGALGLTWTEDTGKAIPS